MKSFLWPHSIWGNASMPGHMWGSLTRIIKKKIKFSPFIRKFRIEQLQKSYIRKGFLIYEEMRKYLTIYEKAVSHIWLWNCSTLNFLLYEEDLIFLLVYLTWLLHPVPFIFHCLINSIPSASFGFRYISGHILARKR